MPSLPTLSGVGQDAIVEIYRAVFGKEFSGWLGPPSPEDVHLVFHTYSGFLKFAVQREHDLWLPYDTARTLLWRLHVYNLKWGWLALGGPLVPLLSCFNYWSQVRSLRKQHDEHLWQGVLPRRGGAAPLARRSPSDLSVPPPLATRAASAREDRRDSIPPTSAGQMVGVFGEAEGGTRRAVGLVVRVFLALVVAVALLVVGVTLFVGLRAWMQWRDAVRQFAVPPAMPQAPPDGARPKVPLPLAPAPHAPDFQRVPEQFREMVQQQQRDFERRLGEQQQQIHWPQVAGQPVAADTPLEPGALLQAQFGPRWYPVRVVEVLPDQSVKIRWVGWGDMRTEVVPRSKLQIPVERNP